MRTALIVVAALTLFMPASAEAASKSTARATGDIPVRSGPGGGYRIIGTLADGSQVHLQRCTSESNWCLFLDDDGDPVGWVRGSYLVGSGAKLEVTPHKFLGFNPLDPLDFRKRF